MRMGAFTKGPASGGSLRCAAWTLETGEVLQTHSLSPQYFGEGIAIWEDRIIQLTWKSRLGFVYDKESFELLDTFSLSHGGLGYHA